jgi:hypothetical protein
LDIALMQFEAVRARLAEVESTLQTRDADVAHNTAYIAQCAARLQEQDALLLKLSAANVHAELHITDLQQSLVSAQSVVVDLTGKLNLSEVQLSEKLVQLESVRKELLDKNTRLQGLLSWWVVRLLDRRINIGVLK